MTVKILPDGSPEVTEVPQVLSDGSPAFLTSGHEYWPELPALAKRLGIKPLEGSYSGKTTLRMNDGTSYDLFALVNAFLDRMDEATK
jgi:hypothetical protein